ncbi:hypothetical protein DI005_27775 [Prauserella sp. PE36]|uniref:hypothetical protein n=1 Tax=Prauserella sp. PE36 TaxID=1504709 RepID=UPI000DE2DC81|nr:hypothetical protein [Prauserella sp. PE36]RBM15569.1 hypothetical protein DI005_27775 [Prauserella sp. PE36]
MNEQTRAMVAALAALGNDLPGVIEGLRAGTLGVAGQHEFAALLIELGEQLDDHADDQARAGNGHSGGYGVSYGESAPRDIDDL